MWGILRRPPENKTIQGKDAMQSERGGGEGASEKDVQDDRDDGEDKESETDEFPCG